MTSSVDLLYTILDYLFLALMLVICVVAALMIRRLLQGTPRKLGVAGFVVLAVVTLVSLARNIYADMASYDEINGALLSLLDLLNAFARLAGIGLLGLALLATVRDLRQLFTGAQAGPEAPGGTTAVGMRPPYGQQPGQPPSSPYGQMSATSYGQSSAAPLTAPPAAPHGQPSAAPPPGQGQPWGQGQPPPQQTWQG